MTTVVWVSILIILKFFGPPAFAGDTKSPHIRILFDDCHGQSYGNADWLPTTAYSDLAEDLRTSFHASVHGIKACGLGELITESVLEHADLLVLPEPNLRYTKREITAIRNFVSSGGALFLIADHGGSDRNLDGWDSALICNELASEWNILFLGNTWSEAPIKTLMHTDHPILKDIHRIGAWAATSIIIQPEATRNFKSLMKPLDSNFSYLVAGHVGKGRIVAIGDSAPFDDGSGASDKNRHTSYKSWLYQHRRLAVQICGWLVNYHGKLAAPENPLPYPQWQPDQSTPDNSHIPLLLLDAAHGNDNVDYMDRFLSRIADKLKAEIRINLDTFRHLDGVDIMIMTNPSTGLTESEISAVSNWIKNGGRLLVTLSNARRHLSAIKTVNTLLDCSGSSIRVNADEVIDRTQNTGKPWSLIVNNFSDNPLYHKIRDSVFWGSCSLVSLDNKRLQSSDSVEIIANTSIHAVSRVFDDFPVSGGIPLSKGRSIPVAAIEKIGKGTILLLGANTLSNYQYPTAAERAASDPIKWDHDTSDFNLAIVKQLKE